MADSKETPQETIDRLTAELAEANKKIEVFTAKKKQLADDELVIREKMSHGLTREQSIAVIKRQRDHDAAEAAAKAKAAETKAAAAKGSKA